MLKIPCRGYVRLADKHLSSRSFGIFYLAATKRIGDHYLKIHESWFHFQGSKPANP